MSYIPPHKRQTKGSPSLNPTPAPDFLTPNIFRKSLNLKLFGEQNNFSCKTIFSWKKSILKWFSVGMADYSRFSSLVSLQPFSADYFDQNSDRIALSLVLMEGITFFFWTGRVVLDMYFLMNNKRAYRYTMAFGSCKCEGGFTFGISTYMKREMEEADMGQVKQSVVARFGKNFFYRNSSICEESLETTPLSEATVRKMKRNFYANSAAAYMDYIEHRVVEKLGLEYVKGKELYNIRDEQINGIKDLIGSAILDSEVQGSLRWPIGKDSSGG
uniref:DUF7903 domain-containing protein n=1 Tax=Solanum tuberosum TaxID=4113 RepID=M1E0S5_SOLTU